VDQSQPEMTGDDMVGFAWDVLNWIDNNIENFINNNRENIELGRVIEHWENERQWVVGDDEHSLLRFIEELYGTPARQGFLFRLFDFESRGVEIAESLSFFITASRGWAKCVESTYRHSSNNDSSYTGRRN